MGAYKLGSILLPHTMWRNLDGDYVLYNLRGRPVGIHATERVISRALPVSLRVRGMTPKVAAELSYKGCSDTHRIELCPASRIYDDPAALAAYFQRLAKLVSLSVEAPTPIGSPAPSWRWLERAR